MPLWKTLTRWTAMAGLLISMGGSPALGDPPAVDIDRRPDLLETRHCLGSDECRLCWTVMDTELNRGIISSHRRCSHSLADQVPRLARLLESVLAHNPGVFFHTLFWGRLVPDAPHDDLIMARRLCLAAFRSAAWDRRRGRPVDGEINAWVRDLANSAAIYPELQEIFDPRSKTVAVSGVEKVLVLPARKLPFYEELRKEGIAADDKLPFDAMVWFSILNR